jgi:hypothetical protein
MGGEASGLGLIIALMAGFLAVEAALPARKLHHVPGWWLRVLVVHVFQIVTIALGVHLWEPFFRAHALLDASAVNPLLGGASAYLLSTFIFCTHASIKPAAR